MGRAGEAPQVFHQAPRVRGVARETRFAFAPADVPAVRTGGAERAAEMAPSSVECATLYASVLNLANVEDGKGATDAALAKACAACRDAIHLHRRWSFDPLREGYEVSILHSPGAEKAAREASDTKPPPPGVVVAPVGGSGSPASQVDSLKQMALRAARLLKHRRGAWDAETNWVRKLAAANTVARTTQQQRRWRRRRRSRRFTSTRSSMRTRKTRWDGTCGNRRVSLIIALRRFTRTFNK